MPQEPDKPETDEVSDKKLEDVSGGKLSIGKPNDKYEQEADAVADAVANKTQAPNTSTQSPSE